MPDDKNNNRMNRLDRFSEITGHFTAWLTLLMVVVTFVVVVMRYVFDAGLIWMQESVVWMHAFVFMIGAAYTLQRDEHVRVDIFYREMDVRGRAWVDFLGVLIFLLPLCIFSCPEGLGLCCRLLGDGGNVPRVRWFAVSAIAAAKDRTCSYADGRWATGRVAGTEVT